MTTRAEVAERIQKVRGLDMMTCAWMAGLLEGEGSFYWQRIRQYNYPRIALGMADRDVVERFAALVGGCRVREKRLANSQKWSAIYEVAIQGEHAMEIMRAVLPFMGDRRTARITEILGDA